MITIVLPFSSSFLSGSLLFHFFIIILGANLIFWNEVAFNFHGSRIFNFFLNSLSKITQEKRISWFVNILAPSTCLKFLHPNFQTVIINN
jgi:hypothetical protein